jgi:5-methyltetrahydrofolate--homocysteine methyltransferase
MAVGALFRPANLYGVANRFLDLLRDRVLVADGAMGTMLHAAEPTVDDYQGHEGCSEILNVSLPDVVRGIHDAYLTAGADCIETNTFGANLSALGEYGPGRSGSSSCPRPGAPGSRRGRRPRHTGSSAVRARVDGTGDEAAHLGPHDVCRAARRLPTQRRGLLSGGADALIVETCQDLLQTKAAVIGARRAIAESGRDVALVCHVTLETTGTMLLGSEIGAALTALEPLGIDLIGLNCATGPARCPSICGTCPSTRGSRCP